MSVWFAVPSARENGGTAKLWKDAGYRVALLRDWAPEKGEYVYDLDLWLSAAGQYPGYAPSVNKLCATILKIDPQAEWIVTGGDDIEPDPNHSAEQIALECSSYFLIQTTAYGLVDFEYPSQAATFGVMQPTGDRWGDDPIGRHKWPHAPAYIDRVCGSPWMGREFCRRMYQGQGPLFPGYRHMREDEELQEVAMKLGVLWQRRDLIHYHRHYARDGRPQPKFLEYVAGPEHWKESTAMFEERKRLGFPGHEPIA